MDYRQQPPNEHDCAGRQCHAPAQKINTGPDYLAVGLFCSGIIDRGCVLSHDSRGHYRDGEHDHFLLLDSGRVHCFYGA